MDARFQSLTVKAFRSIGAGLTFELHSPLTLIYAPNGTGKTTLCEAAEWMLTGEVERLSRASGFNASVLSSKFLLPPQPTEVSASFLSPDGIGYLSRKVNNNVEELKIGASAALSKRISSREWLEKISSDLEVERLGLAASEKTIKRWIRGSKFLTVDDLSSLMDTDDSNLVKRMQVFSDLLGVRHLFDAERSLDTYLDSTGQEIKALSEELKALELDRESLKELEKNLVENPVIYWAGFDRELDLAATKLGENNLEKSGALPTGDRIEELGSILLNQDQENRSKLNIAAQIDSLVSGRARDVSLAQDLGSQYDSLKKAIAETRGAISQRNGRIASLQSDITLSDKRLSLFPGMRAVVEVTIKDFLMTFDVSCEILKISRANGLRKLRKLLSRRSIAADFDSDSSHFRILHIVKRELPEVKGAIKNFNNAKKKLLAELGSPEEDVNIQSNLEEVEQDFVKHLKELHAIEQPLARLQAEVKEYFSSGHNRHSTDCPVCGSEHGSSEKLLIAMNTVMASLPKLIEKKRGECNLISAKIDYWKQKSDSRKNLKLSLERVDRDLAEASDREKTLMAGLGLYGISAKDPKNSIDREMVREELAGKLFELLSSINAIEQAFPDLDRLSSYTVEELTVTTALHDYQRRQEDLATKLREELVREKHHLNGLRSQAEISALQLRDVETNLGHSQRKLNDINALWELLAGEEFWSQGKLTKVHKQLLDRERELALLRKTLDDLGRKYASSQAMLRRDDIDKRISELSLKLSNIETRKKLAMQAKSNFKVEYDKVTNERIGHLSGSVNPLFLRMHSNRIYDSVAFKRGGGDGVLRATVAGDTFNPYTDFSQGQRQDLALAIFLARARSVGGTFFLDEPVMHLDDLNRVALLDILRAFTLENGDRLNLVVTTSSKSLTRHLIQKFSAVDRFVTPHGRVSPLTVYGLEGNALTGVGAKKIYGS